ISGVTDHLALNDPNALAICRSIVSNLNRRKHIPWDIREPVPPLYDPRELYGIVPHDNRKSYNVREVIARLVDGSKFDEFKALYGTTLVCGFARLMGFPIGIIANNGILFSESALKATHFIELC
ncbi:MAG TPA: methylcrotonoyl-CoA carboxylase, partial [Ktedonobacter sp.]|nr:methylcrotonoyl-CoA carboxylase [Ktedonobacter sp.]